MRIFTLLSLFLLAFSSSIHAQNIHRTACNGNLARLDSLLTETDINIQDFRGRNLLHWASACKQKEVFDYLVEKDIDVDATDFQNKTALHIAFQFNNFEYVDHLIQIEPNENWKTDYAGSIYSIAVIDESLETLEKLVELGIDINAKNERGSTALEIARRIGYKEIEDFLLNNGADASLVRDLRPKGLYMGQKLPRKTPEVFAPNFISTEEYEFGSVFNKAGDEFYYGIALNNGAEIRYTKLIDGEWSTPKTILPKGSYDYNDPFFSNDEQRLYFISMRSLEDGGEQRNHHDIWYFEREGDGWSDAINAGPMINTDGNEYYISFTKDGTMYFSSNKNGESQDIYYSPFVDGKFQEAIRLGENINTSSYEADVFIDPNEEYMIFAGERPEGFGRGDLYISFKDENGDWTKSMNMGDLINTRNHELCPAVTPDGKYFMYTSDEDIYWVSTEIFEDLKVKSGMRK